MSYRAIGGALACVVALTTLCATDATSETPRVAASSLDLSRRTPQLLMPSEARLVGAPPTRIVSLAPVVTETLFLLNQGARVVGVTRYCDAPKEAAALPKVGGYVDVSLERLVGLKPDLVVAMPSLGQRELLERVRAAGIPVLVVFGDTLGEVRELVRALGDITQSAQRAARIIAELNDALASFAAARAGQSAQRVLVVVGVEPIIVAGPGSFIDELLTAGGVTSAVARGAPQWPSWSIERLSRRHVDLIVLAAGAQLLAPLERTIAAAFPEGERPRVVCAPRPLLMRPGPALAHDLVMLLSLLRPDAQAGP